MSNYSKIRSANAAASIDRFQILIEAIKDYAIYMLDPDGHVISWNSGAERFKGYSELEILGRHFSCFYTAEDINLEIPERALLIAREEGRFEAEGWRVRKDGSTFWASVTIDPIWVDGKLIGYAEVTRDIGQRREAENELLATQDALQHAQKMEMLGRLTSGVAHDFNNMMTVMRSSTEKLAADNLTADERKRCYALIFQTIDHATTLTNQVLNFAQRQPLKPEQFDIVDRILAIRPLLETTLGDAIALKLHLSPDLARVDTDRHQFETAIINLIVNARDALQSKQPTADSQVSIGVGLVGAIPKVRNHPPREGAYAAITITDNGPGLDPAILSRIFEPFFTTKERSSGTGLGLAQVYGFVKQSGGEIDVQSNVGEEARFTLYLPRVKHGILAKRSEEQPRLGEEIPNLSGTILLVEDNRRIAEVTSSLLEAVGLQHKWAASAEDALIILNEDADQFDLVLTDVVMPGMSGIALARQISKSWPELPVVLTSGYSDDLAAGHGGEFDLLRKPYSHKALMGAIVKHLDNG